MGVCLGLLNTASLSFFLLMEDFIKQKRDSQNCTILYRDYQRIGILQIYDRDLRL